MGQPKKSAFKRISWKILACKGHRCLKVLCLPLSRYLKVLAQVHQVVKSLGVWQNSCVGEFVVTLHILKQNPVVQAPGASAYRAYG